jgi:hypothetical protein
MVGSCSTGTDNRDAVQCTLSTTPIGMPCAANEWLSSSLSEEAVLKELPLTSTLQIFDTGTPSSTSHAFRSDVQGEWSVYLGTTGSTTRQTIIKVLRNNGMTLSNYMYPKTVYYSRIDTSGSDKVFMGPYPTAYRTFWDATDVMLSSDRLSIYIFFSYTYDFIAKCTLADQQMMEITSASSSCTYLSTVQFASLATTSTFTYLGCTHLYQNKTMACSYEASGSYTVIMLVDETTGVKKQILGSDTYAGLGKPLSPLTWDPYTKSLYFMADINYEQGVVQARHPESFPTTLCYIPNYS